MASGNRTTTEIHGQVLPEFEEVRQVFIENFTSRGELGAAVAVSIDGEIVVNLWGGIRDEESGAPWEKDTMVAVFSATKGVSGLVMALAHSRGWIDYESRVAEYWPEFAQNGKESITVRQLLSHQAGLHGFHQKVDRHIIEDHDRLATIMEAERPQWTPGKHYAYHIISLGFYEGELIRRVDPDHRTIGRVFQDEIATPLGIDVYIRLPESISDDRLARLKMPGLVRSLLGLPPRMLLSVLNPWSHVFRSTMVNPGTAVPLDQDRVYARDLEVPAGGGVGTARALATAYGEFATGGARLGLKPETLDALSAPAVLPAAGPRDMSLKVDVAYSLGFMKPCSGMEFGHPSAFGTPGAGGSMGYGDPEFGLGYGYVMNRMGTGVEADPRDVAMRKALATSLGHGAKGKARTHDCQHTTTEEQSVKPSRIQGNSPAAFFVLTLLLSIPLYVLGAIAFCGVLGTTTLGPVYLALLTFTPATAAALLNLRNGGKESLKLLLLRVFDLHRITRKAWYIPAFLIGPLIFALSVGSVELLDQPAPSPLVPVWALPAVFPFVFLLAAGEEVGWMGHAAEPLQARYGALAAALLLGLFWSMWHLPFFFFLFPDPIVLASQLLTLIGTRVLLFWIFNNTGSSVFAVILYHAADNTAFMFLPDIKSVVPLGSIVLCVANLSMACLVALLWGSSTLAQFRFGTHSQSHSEN